MYEPSLLLCDVMYNMFSTPTTCCSIGAATVSAITLAFAPGYLAVTWTVGGEISGYSAIGSNAAAMTPKQDDHQRDDPCQHRPVDEETR